MTRDEMLVGRAGIDYPVPPSFFLGVDPDGDVPSVNHPQHYNQIKGIECIEVVEQMPFNTGNAVKYLWRYMDKGEPITDLQKAIWYIEREIARLTAEETE